MRSIGEYVAIEFTSANATSPIGVTLKDANGVTRTLQSFERLLIGRLTLSVDVNAGNATLFHDTNNNAAPNSGEIITQWIDAVSVYDGGPEGYSCPIGLTPKVITASTGIVSVTGVGAIVKGKSEGPYPSWQASRTTAGA